MGVYCYPFLIGFPVCHLLPARAPPFISFHETSPWDGDFNGNGMSGNHRRNGKELELCYFQTMKTPKPTPASPVLVIRWIADKREKDEIAEIRKALGPDRKIGAVRANSKDEVYRALTSWLGTPSARILYIGAHGRPSGLVYGKKRVLEVMEWANLGRKLASVPKAFQYPVILILGACYSSLAPAVWTKLKLRIPVSHVICIDEDPFVKDVVALIVEILANDKQEESSLATAEMEITTLDESMSALRGALPSRLKLRLFLRGDRKNKKRNNYAFVEVGHLDEQPELQRELEKRTTRRRVSALGNAVLEGVAQPVPSKEELERVRAEAKRLNRVAKDDKDDLLPARPLPKLGSSAHKGTGKATRSTR
jgi:hypothetical protein